MIVVSCQQHESVKIGSEIKILVVDISPGAVRLAVDAPKNAAVKTVSKMNTLQGGMFDELQAQRRAPAMTIGQRLRAAISASGQSIDRLATQINMPAEALENFVRRNEDIPLSVVQRIASHFKLQLSEPGAGQAEGA